MIGWISEGAGGEGDFGSGEGAEEEHGVFAIEKEPSGVGAEAGRAVHFWYGDSERQASVAQ